MSIEIKTNKVVRSDGVLSREIIDFKGLGYQALPTLYKDSTRKAVVNISQTTLILRNVEGEYWEEYIRKEVVPEEKFQKIINHCKAAGKHLKACNEELQKKKAAWHGQETIII